MDDIHYIFCNDSDVYIQEVDLKMVGCSVHVMLVKGKYITNYITKSGLNFYYSPDRVQIVHSRVKKTSLTPEIG